jgi:hypothetical protein
VASGSLGGFVIWKWVASDRNPMDIAALSIQALLAAGMIVVGWWLLHDDDRGSLRLEPPAEEGLPRPAVHPPERAA